MAAALAALAILPASAIYTWVDEKGVRHYSENPPPDGSKSQKVEPRVTPPSSTPAAGPSWKEKELDMKRRNLERDQKEAVAKNKADREAAAKSRRCGNLKRDLEVLETQVPVFSRDAKGDKVYLEDRERPATIASLKREIDDHCR